MDVRVNQSINKLRVAAQIEIILDAYTNTNILVGFNPSLKQKIYKLKKEFERESAKTYKFLESSGEDEVIRQYYQLVNIHERLTKLDSFEKLTVILNFIDEYLDGEIEILEKS